MILCCILTLTARVSLAQHSLPDYIRSAKQNSVLLNQNVSQAKVNALDNERQKAQILKPQVSLIGNYMFAPVIGRDNHTTLQLNPDVPQKYIGYDIAASNGGMYQALINVNKQLFNGSTLEIYDLQNAIAQKSLENASQLTEHEIEKLVTDQYILCRMDLQQLDFADTMLAIIHEQQAIVRKLIVADLAKQSDLSLLNIEYQGVLGAKAANRATYARDLMDLNLLAGIDDTTVVILPPIALELSEVAEESRFMEKYRLDSAGIVAAEQLFETKYQPAVSVYSNAGLNAVYAPTIPSRFGLSGGISFNWILYDGKQKSLAQEKAEVQLQSNAFARENFQLQNATRLRKILAELNSFTERAEIVQAQLREYGILLQSYQLEIMQGQISATNYVSTLKSMSIARRDLLTMQTNRDLLINAYNYWNW